MATERARERIGKFSRQPLDEEHWDDFARSLFFVPGSFADMAAYKKLQAKLTEVDHLFGIPGSRVFYLSIPPQLVEMSVAHLRDAGMVSDPGEEAGFTRTIVEKPIGRMFKRLRIFAWLQ